MSAKPSKKNSRPTPATPAPAAAPIPAPQPAAGNDPAPAFTPWIESTDPRKRALGKALLAGLCLYVAALWLLALDQTFNWGLFGPQLPPLP